MGSTPAEERKEVGARKIWAVMQSQQGLSSEAEKALFRVVYFGGEVLGSDVPTSTSSWVGTD